MARFNPNEWTTQRVLGRVYEVCTSQRTGEVVVLGHPDRDDEDLPDDSPDAHNCDANGCGQTHVLWRGGKR